MRIWKVCISLGDHQAYYFKDKSVEFSKIQKVFKLLLATRDGVGAKGKILIFEVSSSLENAL